ncbi:MAG: TraY domain-containing protein [Promicromonosporaceae bacterium]|nr:TraY domain-containing protein [Promicromonosporaceae bacterium]
MKTDVVTFRLDAGLSQRLTALAESTNRSKTFYAREALERHIEDLEDYYLAVDARDRLNTGAESIEDWDSLCAEIDAKALVAAETV